MTALLAMLACSGVEPAEFAVCDLQLIPDPAQASAGDSVSIVGGPFSVGFDTVVTIAGLEAEVVEITRDGCDFCDACRSQEECLSCGTCLACDALCDDECVETTIVIVPLDAPPGETSVSMVNTFGTAAVPFRVRGMLDTSDTGHSPPDPTGDTGPTASTADTGTSGATGATAETGATPVTADTSGTAHTSDTATTGDTGP